jgi:chitinase
MLRVITTILIIAAFACTNIVYGMDKSYAFIPIDPQEDTLAPSPHTEHKNSLQDNQNPYSNAPIVKIDTTNKNPEEYDFTALVSQGIHPDSIHSKFKHEVFGWYPHWFPSYYKEMNFDLISTVAYFSFEFNPANGKKKTAHDWATTPLVDSAKAHGCKVLLTVSSMGYDVNHQFLSKRSSVDRMIEELVLTLKLRNADGICLDFEKINSADRSKFTEMVRELSRVMKMSNPNYVIYMAVPSIDYNQSFDFATLDLLVDKIVIMGYGFSGSWSEVPKPLAPIEGGSNNLTTSVDYYLGHFNSKKIILALPTYGVFWDVTSRKGKSSYKFIGYRTLNYINSTIVGPSVIDSLTKGAFISYKLKSDTTTTRQIWYNNEVSFYYQMKLIESKNLGGVGIWALGFEKNCPLLWEVIADNSIEANDSIPAVSDSTLTWWDKQAAYIETSLANIESRSSLIIWVLVLVVSFGLIGCFIAFFDSKTREYFLNSRAFRILFTSILLISILSLFVMIGGSGEGKSTSFDKLIILMIGSMIGIAVYALLNTWLKTKKNQLP